MTTTDTPALDEPAVTDAWDAAPERFATALLRLGTNRAWLVTDAEGRVRASHPDLTPLASSAAACPDHQGHEACFFEVGTSSGHLCAAFLHDTRRGQGAGGLRFWRYGTLGAMVRDGLRLAQGMGQKSALAGLWWGGGKGVIARHPDRDHRDAAIREAVFEDYGRFVSSLAGCYITAEDVGTTPDDMATIHRTTRFATCVPGAVGGSGNPSQLTAEGVVVAMESALDFAGRGSLAGKTIAMQGLGNVARFMIEALLARDVRRIIATDIDPDRVADAASAWPSASLDLRVSEIGDPSILAEDCDVLAPNAIGGILDPERIASIRAPIVCGAANNQLARPVRDGAALRDTGILYVPDFLANRMGIVNCANEQYGSFDGDPAIAAHLSRDTEFGIWRRTREVLERSAATGRSSHAEAEDLAAELMAEPHPIWPHRGRQIIDSLVANGWAES